MKQGYDVFPGNYRMSVNQLAGLIQDYKPDVVFQTGVKHLWLARKVKELNKKLIFWYPDARFIYVTGQRTEMVEGLHLCDAFVTTMRGHVNDARSISDKMVWIPGFFSNDYYVPTTERDFLSDVAFVGNAHSVSPQRSEYMNILKNSIGGVVRWVGNGGWERPVYGGSEVANIYHQSKIGLNIISGGVLNCDLQHSVRVFDVMGCGAMLLTEAIPNLDDLFKDGVHLVQFKDKEDLIDKARYYLAHDAERERIAMAGQREIFAKHLISHRIPEFGRLIKKVVGF